MKIVRKNDDRSNDNDSDKDNDDDNNKPTAFVVYVTV